MKETSVVNNLEIHKKENYVLVSINPVIYPLQVVYSAAYTLMDRAYIIIGGDPREEIIVELRPMEKEDLEQLGRELNNELLNYAVYAVHSARNQGVRDAIVQRAFATNDVEPSKAEGKEESDVIKDPLGIAKPWKQPEDEEEE